MIHKAQLCEKKVEIYPYIGQCGMGVEVETDQ
jgi:hypothetical protein